MLDRMQEISKPRFKRLIICCDGTWNTPERRDKRKTYTGNMLTCPTNVVKMARAIVPRDAQGVEQVVFYNQGVGTGGGLDHFLGGALGIGLSKNVQDVYRFLVDNYSTGDEVYLFGFSRGAFTVRSMCGLIRNCGLLKKTNADKIPEAYELYRDKDRETLIKGQQAIEFRHRYSREIGIKFLGVWDTVGTLGIPFGIFRFIARRKYQFHDTTLNSSVEHAYQALAIDEKRKLFKPALWKKQPDATEQKMEQVWFTGVHSNVGGGYDDCSLSDITFQWMREKAEACGLAFDEGYIKNCVKPNSLGMLRESKKGFYRLFTDYIRGIGEEADSKESVHITAIERKDSRLAPPYAPENLIRHLKKNPIPMRAKAAGQSMP